MPDAFSMNSTVEGSSACTSPRAIASAFRAL
jgi:hypothetical protein